VQKSYETLFIVNPDLEESEIEKILTMIQDLITHGGGSILKLEKWGRRQLAYMIEKKREGFYVLIYFEADVNVITELTRRYKLTDTILRHLILQLDKVQLAEVFEKETSEKKAVRSVVEGRRFDEDESDDFGASGRLVASTEG